MKKDYSNKKHLYSAPKIKQLGGINQTTKANLSGRNSDNGAAPDNRTS